MWVRRGVGKEEGGREGEREEMMQLLLLLLLAVWAIFQAKRLITPGFHSTQSYTYANTGRQRGF